MSVPLRKAWLEATQYLIWEDFPYIVSGIYVAMFAAHDDACWFCSDGRKRWCQTRARLVAMTKEEPMTNQKPSMVTVRCLMRCDKYMEGHDYVMRREYAEMLIATLPQAFQYVDYHENHYEGLEEDSNER
jgi:hypothetical protein